MSLLSKFLSGRRGESSVIEEHTSSLPLDRLPVPFRVRTMRLLTSDPNSISPSERYARTAQDLRLALSPICRWLDSGEIKLIGEHPIAAGGFANIWEAVHGGRKVVLKSYRCYMTSNVTQVVARFHNEVDVWSLLHHGDTDVLPLVGVYSTETHPFGLIYEHMDGLDLKQYLRNEPNVGRLKLLTEISRCLNHMHDLGIVHGGLQTVNILVDKFGTVHISGLGNAYILPQSTDQTAEGGTSPDRLSRSRAPELTGLGVSPNAADIIHPTKASDMYAFGVMSWEILTGRPPFSEMTEIAATYSMLTGARPPRPNHHEISDGLWCMIKCCWDSVPSKRMSAKKAVETLEIELQRTSDFCIPSHA